ncbi:MAG TPA: ribonuclease HI family protein [Candidatus Nanoarchaeia archaeon]|nr:ribonuclease HI family protein [Candidatus Nanoarchaeia archaeon]
MIYINCDGGSRGNPGKAAIGIVLWDKDHKKLKEYKEYIGIATNNIAEYKSLIKALELAIKYSKEVEVNMDSELVIKQIKGIYKVKATHLPPLLQEVKANEKHFKKIIYHNVSRENIYQKVADFLVNKVLDEN